MADYFNLDFDAIKSDIKDYIKNNSELLADYNYEGSIISSLINVLSYVTQYNAHYINQLANETTISTAKKESNIYKLANMLNYIPKRNIAPTCTVRITNNGNNNRYLYFGNNMVSDGVPLVYLGDTLVIEPAQYEDVTLHCGTLVSKQWTSDGRAFQTYELSDRVKIDNNELYVGVANDPLDLAFEWQNINVVNPMVNGKYYYIDYLDTMSIKFDDGSIYQKPNSGQVVAVRYLKTEGSSFNGAITVEQEVTTNIADLEGECVSELQDGENGETIEEVKNRAILTFTTQNRAITKQDYYTLFSKYDGIKNYKSYSIYGGEDVYIDVNGNEVEFSSENTWYDVGYVYFSILKNTQSDVYNFEYLTETEKLNIESYLNPYKIITMFFKFTDPVIIYVKPSMRLKLVSYVGLEIRALETKINDYLYETYSGMGKKFSISNVVNWLDGLREIDYCEMDYDTKIKVKKGELDYKVIPIANKINDLWGRFAEITMSPEATIKENYYILDGENKHIINHVNYGTPIRISYQLDNEIELTAGTYDVYDYNDEYITTIGISNINTLRIDGTSESEPIIINDGSTDTNVGTVNCETGFVILDSMTDTILESLDIFYFDVALYDEISFNVQRELFLCPEKANITYI